MASGRVVVRIQAADARSARVAADQVARGLRAEGATVIRASATDFVNGQELDAEFLTNALLDPFQAGESFPLIGSRSNGDVLFDPQWTSAPPDAYLVIDGAR